MSGSNVCPLCGRPVYEHDVEDEGDEPALICDPDVLAYQEQLKDDIAFRERYGRDPEFGPRFPYGQ